MTTFTKVAVTISRALSRLIVGGLVLGSVAGLVVFWLSHERVLSVQTASMVPTFRPGDAVFLRRVAPTSLKPGDIISYRNPLDASMIITHRLVSRDNQTGRLTTLGDNSSTTDPDFPAQQVVGQVAAVAPKLGRALDYLHEPIGLASAVYLPAALVVGAEARRVIKGANRPYQARIR